MSATNAAAAGPVAALAQGLRELRDNADGPDGVELELLTRLEPDVIQDALRGTELPTLGVTLSLVDAWGGDVEAWALYWSQINEIAVQAQGVAPQPKVQDSGVPRGPVSEAEAARAGVAAAEAASAGSVSAEVPTAKLAAAEAGQSAPPAAQASTPQLPQPAVTSQADAAQQKAKPDATAKPKAKAAKNTEDKPRRTPLIIGVLVVLAAAAGGAVAYTAVHHDAKKPDAAAVGNASSTKTPTPTSSAAASHSPASTPSPAHGTSESATTVPTTSAPGGATYLPGDEIGNYPQVQLPSGYSVDFLDDPSHPIYGTGADLESLGFQASVVPGSQVSATEAFDTGPAPSVSGKFLAGQVVVFDADEAGTFERCQNDTRYQSDVDLARLSVGSQFCVHTPGGRLALVRVDRMPEAADANPYVVIDMTVWQGR